MSDAYCYRSPSSSPVALSRSPSIRRKVRGDINVEVDMIRIEALERPSCRPVVTEFTLTGTQIASGYSHQLILKAPEAFVNGPYGLLLVTGRAIEMNRKPPRLNTRLSLTSDIPEAGGYRSQITDEVSCMSWVATEGLHDMVPRVRRLREDDAVICCQSLSRM